MALRQVAAVAAAMVSLAAAQSGRKTVVVVGLPEAAGAELRKSAPANVRVETPAPDQFMAALGDAEGLITPQLSKDMLRAGRKLQWVHVLNAGVEDVVGLVKDTNITLTNLKGTLGPEVADHAMALLLALTRGLTETIPARKWEAPSNIAQLTELRGRAALVVGAGGVGMAIAERAAAFGMTVTGVDPKAAAGGAIRQMVLPSQLDQVLPAADVVFVAAPETPATRGMMGVAQFREMKRGAYFIAVSRGPVYSMDGLVEALGKGRLAGAGVDVAEPEPLPKNHPLWKFKNVVVTPHIAGASDRSLGRVVELVKENIRRFGAGEALLNMVDKTAGY
jgi:phosphoglycerate dehydrogenase-like enzyme